MVIVAGHLIVDPSQRDDYLSGCIDVVRAARDAQGCLDFAISADPVDHGRINILERWTTRAAVAAFRGGGPTDEQGAAIKSASIAEYDVGNERTLL